jgi:hypothetical protein
VERLPRASALVLIAANAIPLAGVLFLGWEVFPLIFLYWFENVVVGVVNVLKMLVAQPAERTSWAAKLFLVPFFCFHYGIFTFVHGVFVFSMFSPIANAFMPTVAGVRAATADSGVELALAVAAIGTSHLLSFIWNFLRGGEFRVTSPAELMGRPYARVVVMHAVVLIGGVAAQGLGSPTSALVLLIVLKTVVDLAAHASERKKFAALMATNEQTPASA